MNKTIIYFILTTLMSLLGTKTVAYDIAVENSAGVKIYYNYLDIDNELAVVKGDSKYTSTIVIPDIVTHDNNTFKVTRIGSEAFYECDGLTSVIIPNTVRDIEDYAFSYSADLTSVPLGNNVTTIGNDAFSGCYSLSSINIPDSMKTIGGFAFANCKSLASINIPNSVTAIGYSAFSGCESLTSIIIPNSVNNIGGGIFTNCISLISVTIPDNMTNIVNSMFSGCSALISISIPNSVKRIEDYAFAGFFGECTLSRIESFHFPSVDCRIKALLSVFFSLIGICGSDIDGLPSHQTTK